MLFLLFWSVWANFAIFYGCAGILLLLYDRRACYTSWYILSCWFWLLLVVVLFFSCPYQISIKPYL